MNTHVYDRSHAVKEIRFFYPVNLTQLKEIFCKLEQWEQNYRSRKALLKLSDAQLEDIGLTRTDALEESQKPFWINQ